MEKLTLRQLVETHHIEIVGFFHNLASHQEKDQVYQGEEELKVLVNKVLEIFIPDEDYKENLIPTKQDIEKKAREVEEANESSDPESEFGGGAYQGFRLGVEWVMDLMKLDPNKT